MQTYLLAIAQGSIIMAWLFSAAYLDRRYKQKLLIEGIYTIPAIVGTIVFLTVKTSDSTKVGLLIAF